MCCDLEEKNKMKQNSWSHFAGWYWANEREQIVLYAKSVGNCFEGLRWHLCETVFFCIENSIAHSFSNHFNYDDLIKFRKSGSFFSLYFFWFNISFVCFVNLIHFAAQEMNEICAKLREIIAEKSDHKMEINDQPNFMKNPCQTFYIFIIRYPILYSINVIIY